MQPKLVPRAPIKISLRVCLSLGFCVALDCIQNHLNEHFNSFVTCEFEIIMSYVHVCFFVYGLFSHWLSYFVFGYQRFSHLVIKCITNAVSSTMTLVHTTFCLHYGYSYVLLK